MLQFVLPVVLTIDNFHSRCNLLEQVESDATDYCHGSKIPLKMKPFQVESYIVYIDCGTENMNTT